ncbi:HEAT repeat domain-containing protein [Duganella sp. FT3S]|uniref:HEAT repeat domain-containing protein n=1 Tax=Rugamonas fusca TaxID=2758568 RepID=A0A7W2EE24_9BURK|nr:HEAT repeat domain-containing protein [Rugamonas fusca]MBA5604216.1 HEAT repeat domain-containing protein [Rugamonas fusca]
MEEIFCVHCFAILPTGCDICPSCHEKLSYLGSEESRDLLLKVLHDKRAKIRSDAIFALGRRNDRRIAGELVACALRHPADINEGLQIVKVLAAIDDETHRATALQYLIARHPASQVKQAALSALDLH